MTFHRLAIFAVFATYMTSAIRVAAVTATETVTEAATAGATVGATATATATAAVAVAVAVTGIGIVTEFAYEESRQQMTTA